jgi:alpha,alpha-trehalase
VATSTTDSGVQWDLPYGWAPITYFAVGGLERAGDAADVRTVAQRFMQSVRNEYGSDGTIREKYNVVQSDANIHVTTGYTQNVIGFGWTNGVYLRLEQFLAAPTDDAATALGLEKRGAGIP